MWIWNSWLLRVVAWMLCFSDLLVGWVWQSSDLDGSKQWLLVFILDLVVSSGLGLIVTMGNELELDNLLTRAGLAREPSMCLPNLIIVISSWEVFSASLCFIIKSSSLLFFYKKANFFQKKQVIFSVLIFLPTQTILNYSVLCMLIFCMNQHRCSLSVEEAATQN